MSRRDRLPPYIALAPGDDVEVAVGETARDGWRPFRGFVLPPEPWDLRAHRLVVVGPVPDEPTARSALLCAVRGTGLVVTVDRAAPWAVAFLADLARLRPPEGPAGGPRSDIPLSDQQRALLDLLADGQSIAQAARRLYLSLRTANRRVAEARAALGVATTREAVVAYVRQRDAGTAR